MRHTQTAVLERGEDFSSDFATEPYEVAWAGEARFFVQRLEDTTGDVELRTQVSPDGITWVDAENTPAVRLDGTMVTWPVREFGGWLRVSGTVSGLARLRIYLVCKG
ncbi:hypothetical protein OCAE111667_24660 [Occultella aeris]|uniref:Uncharacterized protein n=1 Tax=Occultella aeris TaxID=2761496 RepID=A0A7M4DHF1_9MICO|nr:hypothetical protein [Occultella aeris]VZO36344.1 hypothetical protein HALOF300_01548 [Occultella aeris]